MNQTPHPPGEDMHYTVDDAWLARRTEPVIEPALPIVDPHHHLWERAGGPRYLLPDLLADIGGGHNVGATVFVECTTMYRTAGPPEQMSLGETEFANGIAAMSASGVYGPVRVCAGIVGYVNLQTGAAARALLEAHVRVAGTRFRGVRHSVTWHADPSIKPTFRKPKVPCPPGVLLDARFREGFACLAPLGLSYDAWLYHTQLDELCDLARAFPGTTIITNHFGGPLGMGPYAGRRDAVFAEWKTRIARLAQHPNVCMKLGGLGMRVFGFGMGTGDRAEPPSSVELADAWRPYVETCIEAFGTRRCMFESNFPVDKGSCSYTVVWNAFKRIAAGASAQEKTDLFSATARRAYALDSLPAVAA